MLPTPAGVAGEASSQGLALNPVKLKLLLALILGEAKTVLPECLDQLFSTFQVGHLET
jgi:hypothetical protein